MAAPRPMTPAMSGVPASNLLGSGAYFVRAHVTDSIMSPPPMNGGIASSRFFRPHNTPTPVGPNILTGEGVKIAADIAHVSGEMRDPLRAVDQHLRAGLTCELADTLHVVDRAQR